VIATPSPVLAGEVLGCVTLRLCVPAGETFPPSGDFPLTVFYPESEAYLANMIAECTEKNGLHLLPRPQYCDFGELLEMTRTGAGASFLPEALLTDDPGFTLTGYFLPVTLNLVAGQEMNPAALRLRDYLLEELFRICN